MAIPPAETLNSRRVTETLRAAELGWVSTRAAEKAVKYTHKRASEGELTDALDVLVEREGLSSEVVEKILRDESCPKKWWKFWVRKSALVGVWGASNRELLEAMYGMHRGGYHPAHAERAVRALQGRAFSGGEQLKEVIAAIQAFSPRSGIFPDPIRFNLKRWIDQGLDLPADVVQSFTEGR
ncbi:MAG: hypothetical protein OEY63_07545 [Gemmatimonadota bacterium]|nr:hypothetical protein [Gemmatimonadota bacterium]MDH5805143.1 hypothetical protein [Gemmatimonadota bacterium]